MHPVRMDYLVALVGTHQDCRVAATETSHLMNRDVAVQAVNPQEYHKQSQQH